LTFSVSANQTIQVLFNGASHTPNQVSGTSIIGQVPSNATSDPVTVVVGRVSSDSINFTVDQQPTITSVSPSTGLLNGSTVVPVTISEGFLCQTRDGLP
jgi:hypothetical protein